MLRPRASRHAIGSRPSEAAIAHLLGYTKEIRPMNRCFSADEHIIAARRQAKAIQLLDRQVRR